MLVNTAVSLQFTLEVFGKSFLQIVGLDIEEVMLVVRKDEASLLERVHTLFVIFHVAG